MSCFTVCSPNGRVQLQVTLCDGQLFWQARQDDVSLVDESPVGLELSGLSLTKGFSLMSEERQVIDETYKIAAFKKNLCRNHANAMILTLANTAGQLVLETRAYDDGVALRMRVAGEGACQVMGETTGFAIPEGAWQVYA